MTNQTELTAEHLYKKIKITALNGALKTNRSIKFEYTNKNGLNVYYVSQAGFDSLKKKYNISFNTNN